MWKNGTPRISRKSGTNSLKPWSEKQISMLIICYLIHIYICFAYTKETLEAYKKTFHWIHFNPFWDLKHVTALSTRKNFFKGFNGHHTERLRASEIFHARNSRIYRHHKWYCPWFLPRFNRPSAINVSMKAVPKYEF